ncbi:MAG: phosphotransferase [Deltaproteobacteria bacterium]|nr:phosphotransferase [Deltaproteobacteria bacterium]MBW2136099.1 phosphotransferase [Deltaproteobacteria bacterium]
MSSMIEDLQNPLYLPDKTARVTLVQTHISLVFMGDDFVYKVKKPVNFGFLDFSTLEKRRHFCYQEVRLNKRLCQGIYLDVLPVLFNGTHHRIGQGKGEIVDYAVRMKRIPEKSLMKSLFRAGKLRKGHLRDLATVLGGFHQRAERSEEIDAFGRPERIKINTDENFEQTRKYVGTTISPDDYRRLLRWTEDFYERHEKAFNARVGAGKIRDCHGDLHMEHVCLSRPICIFDCIEFIDRFRYTDTLCDIAFLLMDMEYHGGKDPADSLWKEYCSVTEEQGTESLLVFYKVYRAYVRGKVNSFQLDDERIGEEERKRAAKAARKYFKLALSYIG